MAANPPLVEVFNVPQQTNYATGPGGSAASVVAHNQAIQYVCDLMDYVGFPVALVDYYSTFYNATGPSPFYNTNVYGDAVHPTNYGHYLLAQAAEKQINRSATSTNSPTSSEVTLAVGSGIPAGTPGLYEVSSGQVILNLAAGGDGYPALFISDAQGNSGDQFFEDGAGSGRTQVILNYGQFQLFADGGILTNTGPGQFGGLVSSVVGFTSRATGYGAPTSTSGLTNANGVTWIYDVAGTNVTIVQFDSAGNWWDSNVNFTGSKEFIIQNGGGWTNTGVLTVTGGHAF